MLAHLRPEATLSEYDAQAARVLEGWLAEESEAESFLATYHPRFRDPALSWKAREVSREELRAEPVDLDETRLAVARWYDFADWASLAAHVELMADPERPTRRFEEAVEAVVDGDEPALVGALAADPELVERRSARITCFDPPVHGATLLHYLAANGVEQHRQRSPANAPEMARLLLSAGAEADALASCYGGSCTTMSLLVSSSHPAEAGVQVALVDVLVDHGASVEPRGTGRWTSPLHAALVFGHRPAAEALARRGARITTLTVAAGLGRLDEATTLLADADADADERHRALALAAISGETDVVRLLVEAGEDPSRFNPRGFHAHSTPLHQAALAGHLPVVQLLVERGARLDVRDKIWNGTPLGWALHNGQHTVAAYLTSQGDATSPRSTRKDTGV